MCANAENDQMVPDEIIIEYMGLDREGGKVGVQVL
jgi:hypothetical protein